MSHNTMLAVQPSHSWKKKVVVTLLTVALGHVGVFWLVSHMQAPQLPPVEKKPLHIRFVSIQAAPKPAPQMQPKTIEPPKPVKIVEKPQPPAPTPQVVEKVQQVKQAPVVKPEAAKPVKAAPAPVVTHAAEVKVSKPVVAVAPAAPAKPAAAPAPAAVAPKAEVAPAPVVAAPKKVAIGSSGVQWSRTPRPSYTNKDLQGESRSIVVLIEANESGTVTNVRVTKSSGLPSLDEKIVRAVRNAKFKPYKENGVAYPIRAEQPFELTLNSNG